MFALVVGCARATNSMLHHALSSECAEALVAPASSQSPAFGRCRPAAAAAGIECRRDSAGTSSRLRARPGVAGRPRRAAENLGECALLHAAAHAQPDRRGVFRPDRAAADGRTECGAPPAGAGGRRSPVLTAIRAGAFDLKTASGPEAPRVPSRRFLRLPAPLPVRLNAGGSRKPGAAPPEPPPEPPSGRPRGWLDHVMLTGRGCALRAWPGRRASMSSNPPCNIFATIMRPPPGEIQVGSMTAAAWTAAVPLSCLHQGDAT